MSSFCKTDVTKLPKYVFMFIILDLVDFRNVLKVKVILRIYTDKSTFFGID